MVQLLNSMQLILYYNYFFNQKREAYFFTSHQSNIFKYVKIILLSNLF